MRIGQSILYLNAGIARVASVAGVLGAGPSGNKRLDIALGSAITAIDVPHETDATNGVDCWAMYDASRINDGNEPTPQGWDAPSTRTDGTVSQGFVAPHAREEDGSEHGSDGGAV